MIFRRLAPGEWDRIKGPFKEEFNEFPPAPWISTVVVAEEEGEIVALLTLQSVPHIEPMWVRKDFRKRSGIITGLISKMHEVAPDLPYFFAYVKDGRAGRFLERLGMERMSSWVPYRWIRDGKHSRE